MPRYILHPGYVTSHTDGQLHFVGAARLFTLYGVPRSACVVTVPPGRHWPLRGMRDQADDVHLYPRSDGRYAPVSPAVHCDDSPALSASEFCSAAAAGRLQTRF